MNNELNEINKKDYKNLTPFKGWVIENFPFIEADFDAITNYQLICKVTEYLNTVIYNQNQVQDLSNELVDGYNNLLNYVNNYFDNLDLQEEVNIKLDEMASDGTLTNLISVYMQPVIDEQNTHIDEIEERVNSVASGSPAAVFQTLQGLINADPSHSRIYLVEENGNWYYYSTTNSQWTSGGTYQASMSSDEMTYFKNSVVNIDNRNKYDESPTMLSLVDKVINYSTGETTSTGSGTGWTDEEYYEVEDVTSVEVTAGYLCYIMFYNTNKEFSFGTTKNADFNLSAYPYKYVRFCIRKTNTSQTLTKTDALLNVIVTTKNKYLNNVELSNINNDSFNIMLSNINVDILPLWKIGRLTSTGEVIEGALTHRYLDYMFETESINYIHIPDLYRITLIYYDKNKQVVHTSTADGENDFVPLYQYKYVKLGFNLISGRQFQDDLNIYKQFKININASKVLTNSMIYNKDICPKPALNYSTTMNGITYTYDGKNLHLQGTATSYSYIYLYSNLNALPDGFEKGKKYRIKFDGLPSRVNIRIQKATSNGWSNDDIFNEYYYGGEFTIPYDAIGLRIWISVNNGYTVNGDFTPQIFYSDSFEYTTRFSNKNCKPMLTIIYDDGNVNFKNYILPIIQSKKVPISTAVVVSEIEAENPLAMTYEDIKDCYLAGAEVLVHTEARSEQEWGNNMYAIAQELRHAKHTLNNKGFNVPNCYIYSGGSAGYPVCIEACKNVFDCGMDSGYNQSVDRNVGLINNYNEIDPYKIRRRWADTNWTEQEGDPEEILESWIDELVTNGTGWEIWTRHNYTNDEQTNATMLSNLIDYAISQGVEIVTVEKGMQEYLNL